MFRRRRTDTTVRTVEREYGIDLNARGDALIGNLLEKRGFDSVSQLVRAYRGRLATHARRRRVFLSFHGEDRRQVNGFRLMASNPRLDLDMTESSFRVPVDSPQSGYVKRVLRARVKLASVVLCLIGNGTAWREWVDWELQTGYELRKGLCGARLKGSRGRTPPILAEVGAPIAPWDPESIVAAIECAAARRS